ncbi:MAG: EscU/YscU/HrcU family type III secretion system export apparatus switch protein [Nitrospiraceae bacterium]|nr:EscU/YscU/HrcU family type III secretion system export apparatus switch protein [Nitrospiraceae bacterium]
MAEAGERTERATPRKRQKAREQGQVARGREITSLAGMAGVILIFYFEGPSVIGRLKDVTGNLLSCRYGMEPVAAAKAAVLGMFSIIMPFLALSFALALGAGFAQGGVVFKPLGVQMEKLSPVEGLSRIFSKNGLAELLKSLVKFAAGGVIFYIVIKRALKSLPLTPALGIPELQKTGYSFVSRAVLEAFAVFFVAAVADYLVERWRLEQSLMMTKEELKQEYKESEGDPVVKSRIKSLQREAARKRMMQEVPKATVVITNPTHLAVALLYNREKTPAPKIVAKGAGAIAEKIKEVASLHGVPIVEDKPVARALFKLELGSMVPEELYRAVAKIIAYVFKLKGTAAWK